MHCKRGAFTQPFFVPSELHLAPRLALTICFVKKTSFGHHENHFVLDSPRYATLHQLDDSASPEHSATKNSAEPLHVVRLDVDDGNFSTFLERCTHTASPILHHQRSIDSLAHAPFQCLTETVFPTCSQFRCARRALSKGRVSPFSLLHNGPICP